MFNVPIIKPRHKINTVDYSMLLCLSRHKHVRVCFLGYNWMNKRSVLNVKRAFRLDIKTGSFTNEQQQQQLCSHQFRGQAPNTVALSKNATISTFASPRTKDIYLGLIRLTGRNSDAAVSCSRRPDASSPLIATHTALRPPEMWLLSTVNRFN